MLRIFDKPREAINLQNCCQDQTESLVIAPAHNSAPRTGWTSTPLKPSQRDHTVAFSVSFHTRFDIPVPPSGRLRGFRPPRWHPLLYYEDWMVKQSQQGAFLADFPRCRPSRIFFLSLTLFLFLPGVCFSSVPAYNMAVFCTLVSHAFSLSLSLSLSVDWDQKLQDSGLATQAAAVWERNTLQSPRCRVYEKFISLGGVFGDKFDHG